MALELDRDGLPVDSVILAQRLPPKNAPADGWALFLAEIMEAPQSTANVRNYAGIVAECAKRRRLLARAKTVQAALMNPAESWEEIQARWLGEDDPAALFDSCPPSEKLGELGTFEPFPVDCLPKPLGEFTSRAALSAGCDPAFIALPILSALGGCVGISRRFGLKRNGSSRP